MEILVVAVIAAVIYFWIKTAGKQAKNLEERLNTVAQENGLTIFHRWTLVKGAVGLSDSPPAVIWVSRVDKTAYKILRGEEIRSASHEVSPAHNNKTDHTVVFTTNNVRDPSFKVAFSLWKDAAEDFYHRVGILFNLR